MSLNMRTPIFCVLACLLFSSSPAWGEDQEKDNQILQNAAKVLYEMRHGNNIQANLLAKAACVIVLPGVEKSSIGSGESGRGPMSCRMGTNFSGHWSPPAMYSVGSVNVSPQLGNLPSDYVLLIMDQKGLDALLNGETELGKNATAAPGPSAATDVSTTGSDILAYGRTNGPFFGVSMEGTILEPDNDANRRLYDKDVSARDILIQGNLTIPVTCRDFISSLSGVLHR